MQPAHLSAVSKLPPLLMIGMLFYDTPAIGLCKYNGFQPLSPIVSRICINFLTLNNYSLAFPYFIYLFITFCFHKTLHKNLTLCID